MPGQLPNAVKEQRSHTAICVAEEMSKSYRQALVGTCLPVLFEEADGEYYTGHTPNYMKVYVKANGLHNQIRTVRIDSLFRDGLLGKIE